MISRAIVFTSTFSALLVRIKIDDPAVTAKFADGTLTGLSPFVSGTAEVTEVDDG